MYPVSQQFISEVKQNTRKYYWSGTITTKNNRVYEFSNEDKVKGSGYITKQCCGSNEIELGTVYAAELGITLFSDIDRYTLNGALVHLYYHLQLDAGIFREYLEGFSSNKIAKGLMDDGILNGAGNAKWHTSNITSILRNEKYMGDALLQKSITTDYLTKTRVKNKGAAPQYYVEDNHEAIIPKDLFMLVQQELINRRLVKTDSAGKKRVYSGSHILSQKVICGGCGVAFRRIHWNNRGCRSIVWRCISRLENTGIACKARTVNELLLQDIIVGAINKLLSDKTSYLGVLQENIATLVKASSAVSESDIDTKLMALQKELLKKANNKDDYDALAEEIFELRELKHKSELEGVTRDDHIKRIAELQDFIKAQPTTLTEYDENLVNRLLQKITVFDKHFVVDFKSSVSVEIEG